MQFPLKTILVDDERPVRLFTKHILSAYADTFVLIDEAVNGVTAIEKINTQAPDLIFLDIQMPDLNGFQVLQQLHKRPLVIFLTAYDQFAVKAFEENGVDYLLKPLEEIRLQKTIERLKARSQVATPAAAIDFQQLEKLLEQAKKPLQTPKTIAIKQGTKIQLIPLTDVAAFISTEKYTTIKTVTGKNYLDAKSLTQFEQELPDFFLRVQKGAIINIQQIKEIQKHFNSRYNIHLNDAANTLVLTGHTYADSIREKLGL